MTILRHRSAAWATSAADWSSSLAVHQVTDLPHQGLVLVDDGLGRRAVVIEPRGGHPLLEVADGVFGRGNLQQYVLEPVG